MIPVIPIKHLDTADPDTVALKINEVIDVTNYLIGYVRALKERIDPDEQ